MDLVDKRRPRRLRLAIGVPECRLDAQHRRVAVAAIRERDAHVELALIGHVRHFGNGVSGQVVFSGEANDLRHASQRESDVDHRRRRSRRAARVRPEAKRTSVAGSAV